MVMSKRITCLVVDTKHSFMLVFAKIFVLESFCLKSFCLVYSVMTCSGINFANISNEVVF